MASAKKESEAASSPDSIGQSRPQPRMAFSDNAISEDFSMFNSMPAWAEAKAALPASLPNSQPVLGDHVVEFAFISSEAMEAGRAAKKAGTGLLIFDFYKKECFEAFEALGGGTKTNFSFVRMSKHSSTHTARGRLLTVPSAAHSFSATRNHCVRQDLQAVDDE